jgi:quinol monooxygenase YgiN
MAVAVMFTPKSMNRDQYQQIFDRLAAKGAVDQPARSFHACFGTGDSLRIFDIWESEEALQASMASMLLPILAEVGVESGPPEIYPVERILF